MIQVHSERLLCAAYDVGLEAPRGKLELGGRAAISPAELAGAAEYVVLARPDAAAVLRVVEKEEQLPGDHLIMDDSQITEYIKVTEYIKALRNRHESVRSNAAEALGKIGDASAVPALINALNDHGEWGNKDFGWDAAVALVKIGVPAVPALIEALKDSNYAPVRWGAAEALGEIGAVTAVPVLIEALKDEAGGVRQGAVKALGKISDAFAVPALIRALRDGPNFRRNPSEAMKDVCQYAVDALVKIGVPAIPALIAALKDSDSPVRWGAAQALGEIGDASAVPALIEALTDEDNIVREEAAEALGEIGDASAVPALIGASKDEVSGVRQGAVKALGKIGDAFAVPALLQAMKDGGTEALGEIGDSHSLPRKILGSARLSAEEKVKVLDALRGVPLYVAHYHFPDTRSLCQTVLNEQDTPAQIGAQAVLHWLETGAVLLRGSERNPTHEAGELVRASQGGTPETRPDTLLRGAEEPQEEAEQHIQHRTLWNWLLQKPKDVAR